MRVPADLVLWNATVLTMEEDQPEAQGVAVRGDRIVAVGSNAEVRGYAGPDTTLLDLEGKVLLPGFIDAHSHFASTGVRMAELDLSDATSMAEALEKVRRLAQSTPQGQWILGRNWDESKWPEGRYINRQDLDRAAPSRLVALSRVDYHMAVVGSSVLQALDIPAGTPGLMVDREGSPTGVLKESAAEVLWSHLEPAVDAIEAGLKRITAEAHRLGITGVHDTVDAREIRAYQQARAKGNLRIRAYLMPRDSVAEQLRETGVATGLGDEMLKLGPAKLFADGSLGSRTAALSEEFTDEPGNRGMLVREPGALASLVERLDHGGFQVTTHAIGDRGIDEAINAYRRLGQERERRHRIEHFELPTQGALKEAARLGLVASMQPNFIGQWSLPGAMYERRLGKGRLQHNNPLGQVVEMGISLAFGSDHMPFGPLYGIHWAVNGPFDDQRISVEESLRAYTLGAAYASLDEAWRGSVRVGKVADLVVLGRDPREVPDRIQDIAVRLTILGGDIVHKA